MIVILPTAAARVLLRLGAAGGRCEILIRCYVQPDFISNLKG